MARSGKFSFTNPLRKSTAPNKHATATQPSAQEQRSLQEGAPKAQKLLGDTSKSRPSRGREEAKKTKKELSGKPSLISITVSEVDAEPVDSNFGPAVPTDPGDVPYLRSRPSSPLLGHSFARGPGVAGSMTDSKIGRLREYGSSSTLNSFYDAQKSPLAVSQQTSASSARDFALRKGCPSVTSSQAHLASSPLRLEPMEPDEPQTDTSPRRRPPRIDLSMLFPKPRSASTPLLSPHRLTNSPSPLSTDSDKIAAKAALPSASRGKRLTKTPKKMATEPPRPLRHMPVRLEDERDHGFAKNNVVKQRVGIKNWFDGAEGEVSDDDGTGEPEFEPSFIPRSQIGADTPSSVQLSSYFPPTPPFSVKLKEASNVTPAPSPNHAPSPAPISKSPYVNSTIRSSASVSNQSLRSKVYSTTSRKSRSSTFDRSNLQEHSVLHLSSSDSEEEQEEEVISRPMVRASMASSAYVDSDIEVCEAKSVKASARPSMMNIRSFSSGRNSKPITQLRPRQPMPVEPRIPDRRSSRIPSQISDNRSSLATSGRDFLGPEEPVNFSRGSDRSSYSNRQSFASSQSGLSRRRSRVMHVTRQEEMLLENMRQKRATMRQSIIAEAYKSAMDEPPATLHRPRTSGAGVGDADRSFLRLSQQSLLPQRPSTAEDLTSAEATEILSGLALARVEPLVCSFSPRTSLVLSSVDGALPSPSTSQSRASPVTPTMLPVTEDRSSIPSNRGSIVTFAPNSNNRYSHLRGRTNSSHVIMLDAFDSDPKGQVSFHEEEGFPLWAYKDWGDNVVH